MSRAKRQANRLRNVERVKRRLIVSAPMGSLEHDQLPPPPAPCECDVCAEESLAGRLEAMVPAWAEELATWPEAERVDLAHRLTDVVAHRGDVALYGGKDQEAVTRGIAIGIAALSFVPGGVVLFGRRWQWEVV